MERTERARILLDIAIDENTPERLAWASVGAALECLMGIGPIAGSTQQPLIPPVSAAPIEKVPPPPGMAKTTRAHKIWQDPGLFSSPPASLAEEYSVGEEYIVRIQGRYLRTRAALRAEAATSQLEGER